MAEKKEKTSDAEKFRAYMRDFLEHCCESSCGQAAGDLLNSLETWRQKK